MAAAEGKVIHKHETNIHLFRGMFKLEKAVHCVICVGTKWWKCTAKTLKEKVSTRPMLLGPRTDQYKGAPFRGST